MTTAQKVGTHMLIHVWVQGTYMLQVISCSFWKRAVEASQTDEADGKHIVRKLCASQKYHKFDYFLTSTENMSENFGLSPIKQWLDSGDWIENFPDFHELLPHNQEELVNGMNQAAMGLFTRNWMEVKKTVSTLFI